MRRSAVAILSVCVLAAVCTAAGAATFYADPVTGSMANDGSAENPWRTLQEVFANGLIESKNSSGTVINPGAPVKAGDTLLLRSGYHGDISVSGYYNDAVVTVAAETGQAPALRRLSVNGAKNWTFSGLAISTELSPSFARTTLVSLSGSTSYVTVENCHVYSVDDVTGYSANDWLNKTGNGIAVAATCHHVSLIGNTVRNVDHGIALSGTDLLARGNQVINFRGDGMRALNHNQTLEYNTIKNCFDVDDNHDDGIQVFKTSVSQGLIRNMVLRGNTIICAEDPNQPLQGTLQGIGIFEGPHENFRIENNLVITDHWHGITLYWGRDCTVINNTAVNPKWIAGTSSLRTWISVEKAKDAYGGEYSQNCRMANNIAHSYRTGGNVNLAFENNLIVDGANWTQVFAAPSTGDFRLAPGSPAIDAGSPVDAPPLDIEGNARPAGTGWDLGAYETDATPGPPVADAGPDQTVADADDNGSETVTLDGSASYAPGGSLVSWTWTEGETTLGAGETLEVALPLGVHEITLTVANDTTPPETGTDTVTITVAESVPVVSDTAWQSFAIPEQTGSFAVEFDAQPNAGSVDCVIGLCRGEADWFTDLACIFRFYVNGLMDVRNGSGYAADVAAPYTAGTWYHVRMVIDVEAHSYDVTVTPSGGEAIALATGYAFRSEQAAVSQLDHWALVHTTATGATVTDFQVGPPVQPLAVTGWALAADHGLTGAIITPVADGYTEPRLAGLRRLQITFSRTVDLSTVQAGAVTISGAQSGDVSGLIESLALDLTETVLTVTLGSPLPDADTYTVTVTDTLRDTDGQAVTGDGDVTIRVLAGDANGSGAVTAADILAVRSVAGEPLAADTARFDLDGSGAITGADLLAARGRLGNALP